MTTFTVLATETVDHHWIAKVEAESEEEARALVEELLESGSIADLPDAAERGSAWVSDEIDEIRPA